jgi:hypothetical protein
VVLAKVEKKNDSEKKLRLEGAGRVSAPLEFFHGKITEFEKYKNILPYIDESTHDPSLKLLKAKGGFMGFSSSVSVEVKENLTLEDKKGKVEFFIKEGFLKGMHGQFIEEKIKDEVTEVSLEARYEGDLKLPAFLLDWGMEFVGEKMASKMRAYIEDLWQKEKM